MKISKIACVALFSATIVTGAFADTKIGEYLEAVKERDLKEKALNNVEKAIDTLKNIGFTELAKWDGTESKNKKAYDAFKSITDSIKSFERVGGGRG